MKTITVVSKYGDLTELNVESKTLRFPKKDDCQSLIKLEHDTTFCSNKQVIEANAGDYILTISKWNKDTDTYDIHAVVISDKQEIYDLDEIFNNENYD